MKNNFLKIDKPCSENWEKMTPNEKGNFCSLCAKTVIDFSALNSYQISENIKKSEGSICARITKSQLSEPIFDFQDKSKYTIPYSPIASGIILATTLAITQPVQAEKKAVPIELVPEDSFLEFDYTKNKKDFNQSLSIKEDWVIMKGKITSETDGKPIHNAKISYISIQKIISSYSSEDGSFYLEIPAELVDNDNVIRVSYDEIKGNVETKMYYETDDYILTKENFNSIYQVKAKEEVFYLGGIGRYSDIERIPIVFDNGKEIKYKDFNQYDRDKFNNKDYYLFESKYAIAIYGNRAKHGLYLLFDKNQ